MAALDLLPPKAYLLPDGLRPELAQALGPVVPTDGLRRLLEGHPVVCVGDHVSLTCKEIGVTPRLIMVDFRTRRGAHSDAYEAALGAWGTREWRVANPAGAITRAAWQAVREALQHPGPFPARIVVDGEEDLLGLPAFLEAPHGTRVLYGMPGQGVCVVAVDADFQDAMRAMLRRFHAT